MPLGIPGSEYRFMPENEAVDSKKRVDITVIGNEDTSEDEANSLFGQHIARRFADEVLKAKESDKTLVFDMATGSSPKPVWPWIENMVKSGELDLSNVIVIGHEEAWGNFQPGDKSDFDAYRKREFFERNGITAQPIVQEDQVEGERIEGNFLPMRQSNNASEAIDKYKMLLEDLRKRDDVTFFGLYGVGKDGHIAEIQPNNMGVEDSMSRLATYLIDIHDYSVESGQFRWKNEDGGFHPEDNVFSNREKRKSEGAEVGRAAASGYTGIKEAAGIGWMDMVREESMVIAYNGSSKKLAFELTIDGSFDGRIVDSQGDKVVDVEASYGEGEDIYSDLENYAQELIDEGILSQAKVSEKISQAGGLRCRALFQAIYESFDEIELPAADSKYQEVWKLTNRYLGKRSPVATLVKFRALAGRKTELVIMPQDLKDTKFAPLAHKIEEQDNGQNKE